MPWGSQVYGIGREPLGRISALEETPYVSMEIRRLSVASQRR